MKSLRGACLGLSFIALLAVSGFLYYKTQAIDVEVQNQIVRDLRELKQLDTEWDVSLLKSRIGSDANYDSVTTPLLHLRKLEESLVRTLRMVPDGDPDSALSGLKAAFAEKEELVEQFKSQNAVLRNSLRYFPTAAEEFKVLLLQMKGTARSETRAVAELAFWADGLLADILRFNLIPDAELGNKIAKTLDEIARNRAAHPQTLLEQLDLLDRHARIILRQRKVEDDVMARIAAVPTAQRVDAFSNALDSEFRDRLNEKQSYRTYLFVYSGLLLMLLTYAAWRLAQSYRVIAKVNKRLQAANETLERRVAERTAELEKQSAQLVELATHDALTGLINRRQLMTRLEHALQRAQRRSWVVGVMFIDLDGFKAVNDTYGHATGDLVLKEVATRTQRHVRQEDTMARLGGDEFVVLLDEVSREGAIRVAQDLLREISGITVVDGQPVRISASIGISSAQGGADSMTSPDSLLGQADQAMYQAKQQGKGCFRFSSEAAWQ